jgi:prepilin-type N-terminal cleavage/methylation domain-containing protein
MRRRAPASTEPAPGGLRISPGRGGHGATIVSVRQRGFGFIEIIIVVAIVAVAGFLLMQYFSSTAKTVEKMQQDRPLARSRLAADQATLTSVQSLVTAHRAEKGQNPPDKAAVLGLLVSPPKFQCPGNDFDYEPATGALSLTITDDARC